MIWPGSPPILPFLWLCLMTQGWGEPGLGESASSNVVFSLWLGVSYEHCRTPLPSKDFLPQGNPSKTTLDGVKSPLHCQERCQVTRWHWRIIQILVKEPISSSPSIPYLAAGTGKIPCSQSWRFVSILPAHPSTHIHPQP